MHIYSNSSSSIKKDIHLILSKFLAVQFIFASIIHNGLTFVIIFLTKKVLFYKKLRWIGKFYQYLHRLSK